MARELRARPRTFEPHPDDSQREVLRAQFQDTRDFSEGLCAPLAPEDYVVQSMPDCSPTKWHLAHVSWFFETFLLSAKRRELPLTRSRLRVPVQLVLQRRRRQVLRGPRRGLISRPTVEEVYRYRAYVDEHVLDLLECCEDTDLGRVAPIVILGINHEQQHQELILTDLKHMLSHNPLHPTYLERRSGRTSGDGIRPALGAFSRGPRLGRPRWRDLRLRQRRAPPPRIRARFRACLAAGHQRRLSGVHGRRRLSAVLTCGCPMGWATVQQEGWQAPLYWEQRDGALVAIHPVGPAAGEPRRTRDPHQLLRSGCVCPLGRCAACQPRRNGKSPPRRFPSSRRPTSSRAAAFIPATLLQTARAHGLSADVWRRLGMDPELVFGLPRLPRRARRAGRIQRQIYVQSVRAARWLVRHAALAYSTDVSQLLSAGCPLAVHGLRLAKDA